ncbi:MAG: HD domain-containing protein [Desulfobacteraceae bacterium]|nr:HD domain-containing protein [Desulfobacteraceae bacterium]
MSYEKTNPEAVGSEPETPRLGETFICHFMRLLQLARIHESGNRLTVEALNNFISAGRRLLDEEGDEITIEASHGRFFVQGQKLLIRKQSAVFVLSLLGWFERLGLYGLRFNAEFDKVTNENAYDFILDMIEAQNQNEPAEWLGKRLGEERFFWVDTIAAPQSEAGASAVENPELAHRLYSFAYNSLKSVGQKILKGKPSGIRKPLRVIQDITDLAFVNNEVLMGIATIRDHDDYTFTHSVNVAILSICLGQQIGLSRKSLVRLGISSLFHDLGKIDVPREILNKPGPLDTREFQEIQNHPLNGVRRIIKLNADSELKARILLPPFEHHLRYDLSGYPDTNWNRPLSLFGRIIEICDVYDALTSARSYRQTPLSQDRALGIMLAKSGKDFDPVLLKWFVNMLGVLPMGTLVKLNTGHFGLVYSGGDFKEDHLPKVLVLRQQNGRYTKGEIIDLNQRDAKTGQHSYTIASTHHPTDLGIQPAVYLM